ncbi:MAG: helix-turn-helix domain-containing protein [Clostridia bacterium]|nr:helix-turn-helix domain-containing protein [Clostridia bacterium]
MSNLNLKGLWIPIEIFTDKNLSDKEKHIYSLVIFLSQEKQYCFCTNKTISELLNISITQVSKLVNSLKDKGYINIEMIYKENSKEVEMRKLIPTREKLNTLLNKSLIPSPTKLQYPIEEKFKDNKYNNKNINKINNRTNFEQRDYSDFDWNSLYANGE